MKNIVYFGGPIGSGKSFCSKYLIDNYGYKKLSFADPMKKICSKLTKTRIEHFYSLIEKEEERSILFTKDMYQELCEFFNVSFIDNRLKYEFNSIREMLQYIGTDYLRSIDENVHVNKVFEMYNNNLLDFSDIKLVADDVRFLNEIKTLNNLNGLGIYVIDPKSSYKSKHDSEISVSQADFDLAIINDKAQDVEVLYDKLSKIIS